MHDAGQFKPITVLGAGSWGTALALYLARRGQTVFIWSIEKSEIDAMLAERANNRYLPNIPLPPNLHPVVDLKEAVQGIEDILVVVPSVGYRPTLASIRPIISKTARIISATKGLDAETGQLLNEVCADVLGAQRPFAALSGPSFAREVALGLPAAVVAASHQAQFLQEVKLRFHSDIFNIHVSDDVAGVEAGSIVKNVIAIAAGISDGMALGANARSALITLGLQEMANLGKALGGRLETFMGLSGMGDLILTCSDDQSRNRRFGLSIGQGKEITAAEKEIGQVVEGKRNAELVVALAERLNVPMPICSGVWRIITQQSPAYLEMKTFLSVD